MPYTVRADGLGLAHVTASCRRWQIFTSYKRAQSSNPVNCASLCVNSDSATLQTTNAVTYVNPPAHSRPSSRHHGAAGLELRHSHAAKQHVVRGRPCHAAAAGRRQQLPLARCRRNNPANPGHIHQSWSSHRRMSCAQPAGTCRLVAPADTDHTRCSLTYKGGSCQTCQRNLVTG